MKNIKNKFIEEIKKSMAHYYKQTLSQRIKRGIKASKARKKLPTLSI